MAKQRLTDRQRISGVTLTDLLHFVVTGDTSQSPAGSSYKGEVEQLFDAFSSYTCTNPLIVDTVNACNSGITINGNVTINGSATTINTEVIQSKDNNIILNYSGTHATALYGGITVEDGQSEGVDSLLFIDEDGCWHADPGFCDLTVDGIPFTAQTPYLFVDDGSVNSITTRYTENTVAISDYSNIGGGRYNEIDSGSDYSNIGGGLNNLIDDSTKQSFIGGGIANEILGGEGPFNSNVVVGGGYNAIDTSIHSSIVGGSGNTLFTTSFSIIGGGENNSIENNNNHSGILGGQSNTINHSDTFIIGSNITSISANTTHVERFNIGTIDNNESLNDVLVRDTDGTVRYRSAQSIADLFSGNTSGTCITDLFVTNLYGCSPLHIEPSGLNDVYIVENGGGMVGVGTSAPTARLHISGNTRHSGDIFMDNGEYIEWNDNTGIWPTSVDNKIRWRLNNDSAEIYAWQSSSNDIDFVFKLTDDATTSTDNYVFWIDNTLASGGESNDRYPLEMNGSQFIVNALRRYATSPSNSGASKTNFFVLKSGATALSESILHANVITNRVGVNTSSPTETLDVSGKTKTINFQMTSGGTTGYVLSSIDNDGNAQWGNLSSLFTGNTSGDCITDLFVSNIHSCSPLNINPLDEGNVYFGSTSGVTIDLTNNYVGIGESNPDRRLVVSGSKATLYVDTDEQDPSTVNQPGNRIHYQGNTSGATRMSFTTEGNVGIAIGQMGSDVGSFSGLTVFGRPNDSFIRSNGGANNLNIITQEGTTTDDHIRFYTRITKEGGVTGQTSAMHIQGSGTTKGYIGINNDNPDRRLVVSGSKATLYVDTDEQGPLASTFPGNRIQFLGNPSGSTRMSFTTETNVGVAIGQLGSLADSGNLGFGNPLDSFIYSNSQANNLNIITKNGGGTDDNIRFYTGLGAEDISGTTSAVHIQGNGGTIGYVGINNDNPTYRLDIQGTTGRLWYDGDSDRNQYRQSQIYNEGPSTGITAISVFSEGEGNGIELFSVGSGVTTGGSWQTFGQPTDVALYATTSANNLNIINNNGIGKEDNIRFYVGGSGPLTGQTSAMHIHGDGSNRGYIGINNENPTERLDVSGKTKTTNFQMTSGGATGYVLSSIDNDGNAQWGNLSSLFTGNTSGDCITDLFVTNIYGCSPLHIEPSGLNDVYIVENGGNVGVGTTTVTNGIKLDVNGGIRTRVNDDIVLLAGLETSVSGTPVGDGIRVRYETNLFGPFLDGIVFEKTDGNNVVPDGGIMFANIGTGGIRVPAMSIRGNGNVGIGTETPTETLDVSGNTIISGTLNIGTVDTGSTATEVLVRETNGIVNTVNLSTFTQQKYAASIPFTAATSQTVTHNLNDTDVIVQLKDSTGTLVIPDVVDNYTNNTVDIQVSSTETFRVIIIG